MGSLAVHTDRYELTMLAAALADGTATKPAVFECFARQLPDDLPFGVVAGVDAVVAALDGLRFETAELDRLEATGVIDTRTRAHLDTWEFAGDVDGLPDGGLWFPNEPVLTIRSTFADAVIVETLVLSAINAAATIATAAAAMRAFAGDRTLIEMGTRRINGDAAVEAARAAVIAGFTATSNLAAGDRYGVPTTGTAAHAWTLAHPGPDGERAAFDAQIAALGIDTTLLVDTYDIPTGICNAVEAARAAGATGPGGIRIDSGDLATEARRARMLLNSLGAPATRIVVSGDVDTRLLRALAKEPVDGYGIGSKLVHAKSAGFVYKLVSIDGIGVAKASATPGKATVPGEKTIVRTFDETGQLRTSAARPVGAALPTETVVTEPLMRTGRPLATTCPKATTAAAIERHTQNAATVTAMTAAAFISTAPAPTPSAPGVTATDRSLQTVPA